MVTYYAYAGNPAGKGIIQLRVCVRPGEKSSQEQTGVIYRTTKEARDDVARLNGCQL